VSKQKFQRGDLVRVGAGSSLAEHMGLIGAEAIVIGSYRDQYGGDDTESYTLHFGPEKGEASWCDESDMTLVEPGALDLLRQWQDIEKELDETHRDLDWIFANGSRMIAEGMKFPGETLQTLFSMLGGGSLWGSNGEGINFYANSEITISHALPFLSRGDRAGWEAYCEDIRRNGRTA